jgi:hypothetical protein
MIKPNQRSIGTNVILIDQYSTEGNSSGKYILLKMKYSGWRITLLATMENQR